MTPILLSTIGGVALDELKNTLIKAGENVIKKNINFLGIKSELKNMGSLFSNAEKSEDDFFNDLKNVFSAKNMELIARDIRNEDGYDLDCKLMKELMRLMREYDIPYEYAESYSRRFVILFLEQVRREEPEKYQQFFLKDWREKQDESFNALSKRIEKIASEMELFNQKSIKIYTSGHMDLDLKKKTENPSIGIEFFMVDDDDFKTRFANARYQEKMYIRGRCREEAIYCILNELWRLGEKRPVYVVENSESWDSLKTIKIEGNVLIPWFDADEIVTIENNTNIFVLDENTPAYSVDVIKLRPRTYATLLNCLEQAGMESENAYKLVVETHGLYVPMRKMIFNGLDLKKPAWVEKLSDRVKKTCLLLNSWEDIEGDRLIVEALYGDKYERFMDELAPYIKGEDPFVHSVKKNGRVAYFLASTEISWDSIPIESTDGIWKHYTDLVCIVLNEDENLFKYDYKDKLIALFKGESLFWSETLREGMLRALIMKSTYKPEDESQNALDSLIKRILDFIKKTDQWKYIANYWKDISEISPQMTLARLELEMKKPTGLLELFKDQTDESLFSKKSYISILWGIETLLVQDGFFWRALRWLLELDKMEINYSSNAPKDIFSKVFCTWYNFSAISSSSEKINAAKIALDISPNNAWNYIFDSVNSFGKSYVGQLSSPRYRICKSPRATTNGEMIETVNGYVQVLLSHMEFSPSRWGKILEISGNMPDELRKKAQEQMIYESKQMSPLDVMEMKNSIRKLIHDHRYYNSAFWAMKDEKLKEYEEIMGELQLPIPEYEYAYLFKGRDDCQLLNPISSDDPEHLEKNDKLIEDEICAKLAEFKAKKYSLGKLAEACAVEKWSNLGKCLAKYWNDGEFDANAFFELLNRQASGQMAIDYIGTVLRNDSLQYLRTIDEMKKKKYPPELIAKVYRAEAGVAEHIPLVDREGDEIKKIFWAETIYFQEKNYKWVISECKKFSSISVYIDQLNEIMYARGLSPEEILSCFEGIEDIERTHDERIEPFHIKQLLEPLQDAYLSDKEKCIQIAKVEMFFRNVLDWNDMKCFSHMIKDSAQLMADIVSIVFKKDNSVDDVNKKDASLVTNMYMLLEKAHFCPTEDNGKVDESKLEAWVLEFKRLLELNDQKSLFTNILGRLFSYSPKDDDGYEPCVAVRKMIEKYGDDELVDRYILCVYNRRGVFTPTAGKGELRLAEGYRKTARYLEADYPKTALIFNGLYEMYVNEARREREGAENGIF